MAPNTIGMDQEEGDLSHGFVQVGNRVKPVVTVDALGEPPVQPCGYTEERCAGRCEDPDHVIPSAATHGLPEDKVRGSGVDGNAPVLDQMMVTGPDGSVYLEPVSEETDWRALAIEQQERIERMAQELAETRSERDRAKAKQEHLLKELTEANHNLTESGERVGTQRQRIERMKEDLEASWAARDEARKGRDEALRLLENVEVDYEKYRAEARGFIAKADRDAASVARLTEERNTALAGWTTAREAQERMMAELADARETLHLIGWRASDADKH